MCHSRAPTGSSCWSSCHDRRARPQGAGIWCDLRRDARVGGPRRRRFRERHHRSVRAGSLPVSDIAVAADSDEGWRDTAQVWRTPVEDRVQRRAARTAVPGSRCSIGRRFSRTCRRGVTSSMEQRDPGKRSGDEPSPELSSCRVPMSSAAFQPRLGSVKSRYPCSGLAPVAVFHPGWGYAALVREGRPVALANAPFSLERSCRIGNVRRTSPPAEISTSLPTIATCT